MSAEWEQELIEFEEQLDSAPRDWEEWECYKFTTVYSRATFDNAMETLRNILNDHRSAFDALIVKEQESLLKINEVIASDVPMTFDDANEWCKSQGYEMVSIHSKEDTDLVASYATELYYPSFNEFLITNPWIGVTDVVQPYDWVWTDGSPFDYDNFSSREKDPWDPYANCATVN